MASRFVEFVARGIEELRRGLAGAKRVADAAATQVQDVARQAREAREQARAAAAEASRHGQRPAPTGGLTALQDRASKLRGQDLDRAAQSAVMKALSIARRAATLGSGIASVATADDPTGTKGLQLGLHTLASLPIPIVKDVAAIVSQVLTVVTADAERRRIQFEKFVEERINRAINESDSAKRYEEDPRFRQEEDERARQVYVAQRDAGWEPRSGAALEGF